MKHLLLSAVALCALAVTTQAQDAAKAPVRPVAESTGYGLLGSSYSSVTFDYYDLHGNQEPNAARGLSFTNSTTVAEHVDARLDYDYTRATSAGRSLTRNRVTMGAVGYTVLDWAKPFLGADLGVKWVKDSGIEHSSPVFRFTTGLELPVMRALALTPYAAFERSTRFNQNQSNYGVKANYRLSRDWNVIAKTEYQDFRASADTTLYSLGATYHF